MKIRFERKHLLFAAVLVISVAAVAAYGYFEYIRPSGRWALYAELRTNPETFARYALQPGQRCEGAPFAFPTQGVILGLWDQAYRFGHRHAGLDIFSGTEPGVTAVYAAYPGYLSRLPDGESFIVEEFPQGTFEQFVEAGTLLGYMGDFSGDPGNPTGLHLHFSVVKDEDGEFLNELDIRNTYDPSPYFRMALDHSENPTEIPLCPGQFTIEPWDLIDG